MNGISGIDLKFPIGNVFVNLPYTILDVETNEDKHLTVCGYYHFGEPHTHHVLFAEPIEGKKFKNTNYFKRNIWRDEYKFASYYCDNESRLLNIPKDKFLELQPMPFMPKEQFVKLGSLTQTSSKNLLRWEKNEKSIFQIFEHNVSCIIKQIFICWGKIGAKIHFSDGNFRSKLKNEFKTVFKNSIETLWE